MQANKYIFIAGIIASILIFGGGFFTAKYYFKSIPKTVTKTDTFINYINSSPVVIAGKPHNKIVYDTNYDLLPKTKLSNSLVQKNAENLTKETIHDTTLVYLDTTFISLDTLSFDSTKIALLMYGNCYGVNNVKPAIFGKTKQQYITKETTITKEIKPNLFSLYAGITTTLNNKFGLKDISPTIALNINNKYQLGYNYMLYNQKHNFSIITKIK